jgi:HSP20 family protein
MTSIRKYNAPSIRLFNPLFSELLDELFEFPSTVTDSTVKTPVHDVIENDKEYQINLLLAGIKKEDVSIDVDKDTLIIKAERKEEKDLKYNRKETYFGKYERSFILPDNVDKENIDASMSDGILKIIVPKLVDNVKLSKKAIEIK